MINHCTFRIKMPRESSTVDKVRLHMSIFNDQKRTSRSTALPEANATAIWHKNIKPVSGGPSHPPT